MHAERFTQAEHRQVPRWLVAAVVLATGGVTVWAMSRTGLQGPRLAWDRAVETVEGAWSETAGPAPGGELGTDAPRPSNAWPRSAAHTVAGFPGVPAIVAGAAAPHADRGACTNCHAVTSQRGTPILGIRSYSTMPHEYRGLCVNCHQVTVASVAAAGNLVARIGAVSPPTAVPGTGAQRQPTEGEWQGLEVGPGAQGVVVNGAEGVAGRLGVQAGDVVTSINGAPIRNLADFVRVTQNGRLPQGTLVVTRNGQGLAFELGRGGLGTRPGAGMTGTLPPTTGQPQIWPEARF